MSDNRNKQNNGKGGTLPRGFGKSNNNSYNNPYAKKDNKSKSNGKSNNGNNGYKKKYNNKNVKSGNNNYKKPYSQNNGHKKPTPKVNKFKGRTIATLMYDTGKILKFSFESPTTMKRFIELLSKEIQNKAKCFIFDYVEHETKQTKFIDLEHVVFMFIGKAKENVDKYEFSIVFSNDKICKFTVNTKYDYEYLSASFISSMTDKEEFSSTTIDEKYIFIRNKFVRMISSEVTLLKENKTHSIILS